MNLEVSSLVVTTEEEYLLLHEYILLHATSNHTGTMDNG